MPSRPPAIRRVSSLIAFAGAALWTAAAWATPQKSPGQPPAARAGDGGRGRPGPPVVDGIPARGRRADHGKAWPPAPAAHARRLVQAAGGRAEGGGAGAGRFAGRGAVAGLRAGSLRLPFVCRIGRLAQHRRGPRPPVGRRRRAGGFPGAVPPGAQVVARAALRVAPGVRRQGPPLHFARREQPAAHRAGSGQAPGQSGAPRARWFGAARQSLLRQGRRASRDLVVRPSQSAGHGAQSVDRRVVGARAWSARRRRNQPGAGRQELWLAAGDLWHQLFGPADTGSQGRDAGRHGAAAVLVGQVAGHQRHGVLRRRPFPGVAPFPVHRRAGRPGPDPADAGWRQGGGRGAPAG